MLWKTKTSHYCLIVSFLLLPYPAAMAQTAAENPYLAPQEKIVLTKEKAFVLGDTEKVSGTFVSKVTPSPEGRYALIERSGINPALPTGWQTPNEISLLIWDSRTGKTRPLWSFTEISSDSVRVLQWFKGTSNVLMDLPSRIITERQPPKQRRALYVVDLARFSLRMVGMPSEFLSYNMSSQASSTQPIIAFIDIVNKGEGSSIQLIQGALQLILPSGESKTITMPSGTTPLRSQLWSQDGRSIHLQNIQTATYYAVDSSTGAVQTLAEKPKETKLSPSPAEPGTFLRTTRSDGLLKSEQTTLAIKPFWLEGDVKSPFPRALADAVVEEKGFVGLMPDNSAAFFRKHGAFYVVPLQQFDRNAFLIQRQKALQAVTMQQATNIFGALASYTADHEGKLPSLDSPMEDTIGRYTILSSLNDPTNGKINLSFSDPTANLMAIHKIPGQATTTMLGALQGFGGKAVIWADGHVTWENAQ